MIKTRIYVLTSLPEEARRIYRRVFEHGRCEEIEREFREQVAVKTMDFLTDELRGLGLEEGEFALKEEPNEQVWRVKAYLYSGISSETKEEIEKIEKRANGVWERLASRYLNVSAIQRDNRLQVLSADGRLIKRLEDKHRRHKNITTVTFCPDGRLLASAGDDRVVKVLDIKRDRVVQESWESDVVNSIAFSPDGKFLALGHSNGRIELWDVEYEEWITFEEIHPRSINAIKFGPDGNLLASAGDDMTIRIWDAKTAKLLHILTGHNHPVKSIAFSPDNRWLASGDLGGIIRLWDTRTWNCFQVLQEGGGQVDSISVSPNGKLLAVSVGAKYVSLWDVEKGIRTRIFDESPSLAVAFSPDGKHLAAAGQKIILWSIEGKRLWERYYATYGQVWANSTAFSPDGTLLVVGGDWDDWAWELDGTP